MFSYYTCQIPSVSSDKKKAQLKLISNNKKNNI